jgi:hypothetical protein
MRILACLILALSLLGTATCAPIPADITKTVVLIYKDAAGTPAQANGTGLSSRCQSPSRTGQKIPVSNGNSGIAFVVPARFISEILHSPQLENLRQKHP